MTCFSFGIINRNTIFIYAPQSYIDTNIIGTLNVIQSARDNQIEKIIHTSTSEVYGTAQFVPITEKHPLNGQSPYSLAKLLRTR